MTWPLVSHLGDRVLGAPTPGDSFYFVFLLRWVRDVVFGQRPWSQLFFDSHIFYPFGYNLALSETTLSNTLPALPLTALWGEVAAYNLMSLLTFVLSGLGAYLLTLHYTRRRMAAFLAGVVFAFSPYRLSHLGAGHLPLMGTQWLPFLLLYLDKALLEKRVGHAVLAGLFYALGAWSSWYYAYIFALAGAAYVLLRARPWRQVLRQKRLVPCALAFVLVVALLVGPLVLGTAKAWKEGGRPNSLRYVDQFSASPLDFVYPNVFHPLWGTWLLQRYAQNVNENMLYAGWLPLTLAVIALWRARDQVPRTFAWLCLIFAVVALGTTLHWKNAPVYLRVPAQVEHVFTAGMGLLTRRLALYPISSWSLRVPGAIYLPLPTLLLYLYLPFFSAMRVWARFGLVTVLGISVLAGYGWARVSGWFGAHSKRVGPRWVAAAAVAALGLILFDQAAFPYALGTSKVQAQPVDQWLAQQPGDWAVMMYPVNKGTSGIPLYETLVHGKKTVYGQGTAFPRGFNEKRGLLESFPSEECLALLKEWKVRYVLVGSQAYGASWPELQTRLASSGLRLVTILDDEPIYAGDRVLSLLAGTERAFLVDRIYVYEID
jgi:hypothetical protein